MRSNLREHPMKCYRLYMEDRGVESQRYVMQWWQYQPHTLFFGNGSWMGKLEESMVLEMVIPEFGNGLDMDLMIIKFTDEYCNKYNQEAVFVTVSEVSGSTLTKGTRPLIPKIVKQGGP